MDDKPLEILAGDLLRKNALHLAVAESCTGGLVGHLITNVPGSSSYYMGGIISYANEAKVRLLGVRRETLEAYGAVSRETVLEMARGVRHVLAAGVGLSISGIAGPDGGTSDKPVGTTWIGLSMEDFEEAWQFHWDGDRLAVKVQSAQAVLRILVETLTDRSSPIKP